jgi:hypothetical protein
MDGVAVVEVGVADDVGDDRSLDQLHRVLAHPVFVVADVLHQRSAQHDVQDLHSSAQSEHRQIEFQCGTRHGHVEFVVGGDDPYNELLGRFSSVTARIDVAAARQQHAVEVLQHGQCVVGELVDRRVPVPGTPPARATARLYGWLLEKASRLPSSLNVSTLAHTAIRGGGWLMMRRV